jgi:hypothetical protein
MRILIDKKSNHMGANETGSSGNQNFFIHGMLRCGKEKEFEAFSGY